MFCTSTLIWISTYLNFFCHCIWNACMSSARAFTRKTFPVLPENCSFSKVVLQYQYQRYSIVLQYKTARLVHPWCGCLFDTNNIISGCGNWSTLLPVSLNQSCSLNPLAGSYTFLDIDQLTLILQFVSFWQMRTNWKINLRYFC
jgi:hypothetical protein